MRHKSKGAGEHSMNVSIPYQTDLMQVQSLAEAAGTSGAQNVGCTWINDDLTDEEKRNVALVEAFWDCWKALPFDMDALRGFFSPDVTVRTGWRGEHVITGREVALETYAEEVQRQTDHAEVTDFRFPIFVAKGPIVFHTWVWIATSEKLGYHIERPMAAFYLITDGKIERWDSYCTGPESAVGYTGGDGPDGL
jgi:ketosteroid isomerase-like protein